MRQYTAENLLIRSDSSVDLEQFVEVTPENAGWNTISFQARRLRAGRQWSFQTGDHELVLVILSGILSVVSNCGEWSQLGQRSSVFGGPPYALYLPIHSTFTVNGVTDCEFAVAWVAVDRPYPPRLITPSDVSTEIRGGDHATRQINSILPPGFPCQRLVVVEVYTPGGNWSSYPPHKHDVHRVGADGSLLQADLDEVYFYKISRPEGYALQRVYTDRDSPLQQAGYPIDATVVARNNDVVLVPEGYHPVSSPVGYTAYYLNVLAGSAQSLASQDDPLFAWVKGAYQGIDPRVPIYDIRPH